MEKFYLAGKMSGMPDLNFPEFHRVARKLAEAGIEVYNPAAEETAPGTDKPKAEVLGVSYKSFLKRDLLEILNNCTGIVALPSWPTSTGARCEMLCGYMCGKQLYEYSDPTLSNWQTDWPEVDFMLVALTEPVVTAVRVEEPEAVVVNNGG